MQNIDLARGTSLEQLSGLVYELLDAHVDTIRMGEDPASDMEWAAHLDYLRGLQRVGREFLAATTPVLRH